MDTDWPEDPAFIKWLEERLQEAREAQDKEMQRRQRERRDYWLEKTKGEDPC